MINDLLDKQKQLMTFVPHGVRGEVLPLQNAALELLSSILKYLNACGGKPWRPTPLPKDKIVELFTSIDTSFDKFKEECLEALGIPLSDLRYDIPQYRNLISTLGIIEEAIEYHESIETSTSAHQLEELTDILFFYLEQVAQSGFTLEQIEQEYHRKWSVNMKRYEDAEKGDYSWDKRKEGKL